MSILAELENRSGKKCELCGSDKNLNAYQVLPKSVGGLDENLLACGTCSDQIDNPDNTDSNHWRCLNDSMWSEFSSVKVIAWRMLNRLKSEGWPAELLGMIYLEDEDLKWAAATGEGVSEEDQVIHRDSNGAIITAGDTVVLIKDLDVKGGGNFTAKRGTAIRNVSLVHDNSEHLEGKVNGVHLVVLTKFVKKS
ncbi:MAG: PhnA domain-containing protein [Flavobacteriaceae bacterium]|nr:PhnA domain-containing protein [Flavobacteriaceae bacterium]